MEKALYDCKFISQSNFGNLKKSSWARGSRTDKGVHASINVIKTNLVIDTNFLKPLTEKSEITKKMFKENLDYEKIKKTINSNLREDVRVFGLKLVTKNFVPRTSATSRKYEYLFPIDILRVKNFKEKSNSEILAELQILLDMFKGTKNFHNYTKNMKFEN